MIFEKSFIRSHPEDRVSVGVGDLDLQGLRLIARSLSRGGRIPFGAAARQDNNKR
ncbi:hypothetical protein D3C73_1621650 [compost metagenome]